MEFVSFNILANYFSTHFFKYSQALVFLLCRPIKHETEEEGGWGKPLQESEVFWCITDSCKVAEARLTFPSQTSSDSYLPQLGEKRALTTNYFLIASKIIILKSHDEKKRSRKKKGPLSKKVYKLMDWIKEIKKGVVAGASSCS